MVGISALQSACESLLRGANEGELLQALVKAACAHLRWSAAAVWRLDTDELLVRWPVDCAAPNWTMVVDLAPDLALQVGGAGDPEALSVLALMAGRLLAEARVRAKLSQRMERLTHRAKEAEERHRNLTLRLTELRGELDTTQQRHVVLSERNRIAQDLHDRAAQTNFLVALKLDWALAHLAEEDPLRAELERLKELAAQAAAQTREAIYALRAPELVEGGLKGGLRRLLRAMEADGFVVNLTVTGIPVPLAPDIEDALFKIAQEALNNARKHSRGSALITALRFSPTTVTLVVQDDGVGLPDEALPERPGRFGLKGMQERVTALGGELQLLTGDEGGLIVRATIPMKGVESHGDPHRHRG